MSLRPLYEAHNLRPAYKLRYGWTGWPAAGGSFPAKTAEVPRSLGEAWEGDGLRLLESRFADGQIQLTFSVQPHVSPVVFAGRVKGRLQYAARQQGLAIAFSRKLAVRSIGDNHTLDVQQYVEGQAEKEPLADARFRQLLSELTVADSAVDLSAPAETLSGRYWYNLHLVLVTEERCRIGDPAQLRRIRDQSLRIAERKGHAIARLAVMPDHLHVALRGNVEHSPQDIALAFQNNLAFALGQVRVWRPTYYVGTFSEYDMQAVRRGAGDAGQAQTEADA